MKSTFKKGDQVPKWIMKDTINEDAVITFGQDVEVEVGDLQIKLYYKNSNEYVMKAGNDCSGNLQGAPNHDDGLIIALTGSDLITIKNPILEPVKKSWKVQSEYEGSQPPCFDYQSYISKAY